MSIAIRSSCTLPASLSRKSVTIFQPYHSLQFTLQHQLITLCQKMKESCKTVKLSIKIFFRRVAIIISECFRIVSISRCTVYQLNYNLTLSDCNVQLVPREDAVSSGTSSHECNTKHRESIITRYFDAEVVLNVKQ